MSGDVGPTHRVSAPAFAALVGQEVGVSSWHGLDQTRIDRFAALTEDEQFIHCDPVRAADGPFGGTIAHGFLTLSLLSRFSFEALPQIEGSATLVNYGFDKIRFLSPVRSGGRVRGRFTLLEATQRGARELMCRFKVVVEIEGADRPAAVAEWLILNMLG